jgi:AcrR family transcriptional regulator
MSERLFNGGKRVARPIEKRAHIERGVIEVVSKKGLAATTIQDIAQASGVSPGLLYRYWRNRDDLAAHVYVHHYNALMQRLSASLAPESPSAGMQFWAAVGRLVATFLRFVDEQPVILKFLLLCQHELVQHVPPERGIRRLLIRIIEAGQAAGEIRAMNPEFAMQVMLGIGMQPVIGVFYGHLPGPAARHADDICTAMRGALGRDRAV